MGYLNVITYYVVIERFLVYICLALDGLVQDLPSSVPSLSSVVVRFIHSQSSLTTSTCLNGAIIHHIISPLPQGQKQLDLDAKYIG